MGVFLTNYLSSHCIVVVGAQFIQIQSLICRDEPTGHDSRNNRNRSYFTYLAHLKMYFDCVKDFDFDTKTWWKQHRPVLSHTDRTTPSWKALSKMQTQIVPGVASPSKNPAKAPLDMVKLTAEPVSMQSGVLDYMWPFVRCRPQAISLSSFLFKICKQCSFIKLSSSSNFLLL